MGYTLKKIRMEKNMSQTELSEKSGVSRPTIIAIESGKAESVMTGTLMKLAEALGVTIARLVEDE